jgi:DNA-binding MarR family transcriptional regulator
MIGRPQPSPLKWGPLESIAGFHVHRAAVTTAQTFETHIGKTFGLRKVEFSLLMLLLSNEALAPKRLSRALSVTAPNLTLLLDRLQDRGLLTRVPNPLDGRSQNVVLTPEGRSLATQAAEASKTMELEIQGRLSSAEHAMLIELLLKLSGPGKP